MAFTKEEEDKIRSVLPILEATKALIDTQTVLSDLVQLKNSEVNSAVVPINIKYDQQLNDANAAVQAAIINATSKGIKIGL